jgi:hypothetical protein
MAEESSLNKMTCKDNRRSRSRHGQKQQWEGGGPWILSYLLDARDRIYSEPLQSSLQLLIVKGRSLVDSRLLAAHTALAANLATLLGKRTLDILVSLQVRKHFPTSTTHIACGEFLGKLCPARIEGRRGGGG